MCKVKVPIGDIVEIVRGRKVGALTNATVWIEEVGDDLAGVIKGSARETLLLYGEHGIRGDEGACKPLDSTHDEYTDCETRSLYEYRSNVLSTNALADLDVLVVGLHDTGIRHYSYKRTMCHLMQSAAALGTPVVVVDLPNPVRGDIVEGNCPAPGFYELLEGRTDYCWFAAPIAYRHGMTIGELALMARDHLKLDLDLRIIKMEGWRRDMWWDDTGWPYIPMDPSIYTVETTLGFLCTGLFQGTTVSWGIGTADPFRVIGAPWIKDDRLLHALRDRNLAGVTWTRAHFIPRWHEGELWSRFADTPCNGVRLHFTNRDSVCTAEVQLSLFVELCRLYPDELDFDMKDHRFDCRLEDQQWARRLKAGEGVDSILAEWQAMSRKFEEIRRPYLLYANRGQEPMVKNEGKR